MVDPMKFNELPKRHAGEELRKKDLDDNPFKQLSTWLEDAKKNEVTELNAMTLATATKDGKPSCRTVLLKYLDDHGLVFFTNYNSRKGKELIQNPQAMVSFFWKETMRQVLVEGLVTKIDPHESLAYFKTRPHGSKISAWASHQDEIISSRVHLEEAFKNSEQKFEGQAIPLPPYWGGFRLIPRRFEFWHGGKDRLHDRFQYTLESSGWKIDRLSP